MPILNQALIFLGAALIAVPIAKRLGLGAVLGYLIAGAVLGPSVSGLFQHPDAILDVAEMGVVLLLFVIGLELQPSRLWTMRHTVFGLGGLQTALTAALLTPVLIWLAGLDWALALTLGVMLAASSTPLALQMLAERQELKQAHGRVAFSVVLFQDLMAIPLFTVIPLLGMAGIGAASAPALLHSAAVSLAVVAAFLIGGRFVLRRVLRLIAEVDQQEAFTATALFTVAASAWVMTQAGLSPALGAFAAGVLLADSEYRHELEARIEPFKGLLLSLFFIAIGMSLKLSLVIAHPLTILGAVAGLVAVKAAVLYALARAWKLPGRPARKLALVLSQGGEFAFALLILAFQEDLLDRTMLEGSLLVVGLSMATTPLLMALDDALARRQSRPEPRRPDYDAPDDGAEVILAGFGRVGQIVARVLRGRGIAFTALEERLDQVEMARRFGSKVYFGDAGRLDLLEAAGADRAKLFVLAVEDVEQSLRIADTVRTHYPDLPILARARNRDHVYRLMDRGVAVIERETFHSSLRLATATLTRLGLSDDEALSIVERFRRHDENRLYLAHATYKDEQKLIELAKREVAVLSQLLQDDSDLRS
ncbi:Kef-type potassium/proton antiporter (CPA2 family) [Rhodothalassium salexigens DSM 2132]|uniref:Kef-type potassium/proton antiporter (CPA2 family) n=1 Tax=Rhodothalassium salexigens DSM 2132 TaxID=1188247 RepID=A0A4R2PKX1_RHOSA|nr:monovalent cation:proton antiporter-2 (CPA2) family protein [Rhodothalassium salexigens]MBB4211418.1 glutathione-regulated potassium-efflux system ancillary protein KefC/glutathione-regulated potassium-efflux system protein KefB [Rhodothalassium salexigens DSM 2132]MBK1637751.1 hypothetical protein [Rhodothalassium salexigens DSM 2132]TCP35338.1 Kef-type potassium/proton antiporter (CPA2 family) [Rhodothalassium salexigens DSM 2132]